MYNQEVKQHCRRRLIEHAITALTTERSSSVCVQRDNVCRLWEKLDKTEKAEPFTAKDCKKIDDEIRKWERFHDSQVQEKKPSDLRVCYLSGDDPTNDLEVLVENGVLCQNVWAIEKNSNNLEKVLRNVSNSNMRNIRLFNGDLLHFLKEFEGQFDIIYYDACGSLPSAQKTLKVIGYIFLYHKLTSPGALITNFSFPCDEIQRTKTMDRSEKYMDFRKKNTKYEQCFFDTNAYSDYITFQIMDSAYLYIPANRMLSSEKKSLWDQIFVDKGEFITKAAEHEGLIDSSLWLSLLLDKMCEKRENTETSRYKTWVNEIFPDGKFEKKLIIFMHLLSQDVEIFAKLGNKYLEKNFQEMSEILPCEFFGGMRDVEFKRHFLRLVAQLLYGQMAYPSFSVINKSLRLTYTAKQQQMFADVFIFDKCRYLYDQFPSVLFCHLGIKEPMEQMVFRMVADCLQKHIEYVYSDVFEQCHLPTVEPPFEGGTGFQADCNVYIPKREVLDFEYFKENGNKLEKEAIKSYNACQEVALKKNMLKEVLYYSKKVLNLDQNNVKAMFMRSMALKELKQFEEAVENLETICYKLMEDYKLYSPKREVPDFDREQPAQLEQVESIIEKKVLDLEEKGDKMVEKVIESYTACQEICLEINKQNSLNKVLHYAKKVLVLDSKNVKAMCMQAMALKELKKFEEAVQNLEPIYNILMEDYKLCSPKREVLGVDKEQPAQVKQVESILEKKVRNLKEGEKMVEEDIESYIEFQKICLEINTQDSQNNVIIYGNKVLNLDSKNVKAMCMQAMALKALKKFKEAVQNLEAIYYILMEDYKLWGPKREVLGIDKEQPEKVEQNERILEEVLDLEEEEGKKMVNEAIECYIACQKICFKINKQDSQEKVISYGNKVLDLDSNNVTAWCMQAMAFKVLGKFKDAVKKLEISYKLMEK